MLRDAAPPYLLPVAAGKRTTQRNEVRRGCVRQPAAAVSGDGIDSDAERRMSFHPGFRLFFAIFVPLRCPLG